jgi:hypothetical protein
MSSTTVPITARSPVLGPPVNGSAAGAGAAVTVTSAVACADTEAPDGTVAVATTVLVKAAVTLARVQVYVCDSLTASVANVRSHSGASASLSVTFESASVGLSLRTVIWKAAVLPAGIAGGVATFDTNSGVTIMVAVAVGPLTEFRRSTTEFEYVPGVTAVTSACAVHDEFAGTVNPL